MSAEHIRHWRIGDVEVARIVEVNAFEDNISMLLKDETAEFVQAARAGCSRTSPPPPG